MYRTLPHDLDAEKGLLGSMLIAPRDVINNCIERLQPACFYLPAHTTIYELLVEFWNKQEPADIITLANLLRDRKQLDAVGWTGVHHKSNKFHAHGSQRRVLSGNHPREVRLA